MEKATRFVYANRSITFVFYRTDQKKKELLKSNLRYQILPNFIEFSIS